MALATKTLTFISLLIFSLPIAAQYQILGDAFQIDEDCIRLTPAQDGKEGVVWNDQKIDLSKSFDIHALFHFGCSNGGADGMAFVLHNAGYDVMGWGGLGLGRAGIYPSLAVEFDSFQNGSDAGDPDYDHIAVLAHGELTHNNGNNVAGPVQANPDDGNIEDCEYHEIRITWDVRQQVLEVYFDCNLRISYKADIVNRFLEGQHEVIWGFTAATGAKNNEQIVCVEELVVNDPLPDYTMCPGGQIQLKATGGTMYQWAPAEGLSDPTIAMPVAAPENSTEYVVTITDGCISFYDTTLIEVFGDSVSLHFSDTILCEGQELQLDATTNNATTYEWSEGSATPVIDIQNSGFYIVTVTVNDECISTGQADVQFLKLPPLFFDKPPTLCPNESILLDATFPEATYLWQDGSTEATYEVTKAGFYQVEVNHKCGQKISSIDISHETSCTDAYIPNAFSPNFDGRNDYFMIYDSGDIVSIDLVSIFNRWGAKVYEAKDLQPNDFKNAWDGLINGKAAATGLYVYIIDIRFRNGETVRFRGKLSLLR